MSEDRERSSHDASGQQGAHATLAPSGDASAKRAADGRAADVLFRRLDESAPSPFAPDPLRKIQVELQRLGMFAGAPTGVWSTSTATALVEAFGGDEWRTLGEAQVIARLGAATPPAGRPGDHNPRYGEMFRDGVLDVTVGIGFDGEETNNFSGVLDFTIQALDARGFKEDRGAAERLYVQAGRSLPTDGLGRFFVRRDALTYAPPAGSPRPVHVVVRLLYNPKGDGAAAAEGFKQGLDHSDVTGYFGHARYGTGPDFDRNYRLVIRSDEPLARAVLGDPETPPDWNAEWVQLAGDAQLALLEKAAQLEADEQGGSKWDAMSRWEEDERIRVTMDGGPVRIEVATKDPQWRQLFDKPDQQPPARPEWVEIQDDMFERVIEGQAAKLHQDPVAWTRQLLATGRLRAEAITGGNVSLNDRPKHTNEVGGAILDRALGDARAQGDSGARAITGPGREMANFDRAKGARLWMMFGCRSEDYFSSIRATPGQDASRTDLIGIRHVGSMAELQMFPTMLDGLMAQSSIEQIAAAGDARASRPPGFDGKMITTDGFEDNPQIPGGKK